MVAGAAGPSALMANPAAFVVVWLLIRGIRSATGSGTTSAPLSVPQVVLSLYILTASFLILIGVIADPRVGWISIPIAAAPYWLVPMTTRWLQRRGHVRVAYYFGRILDVGWGRDGLAGGLLSATLAYRQRPSDEARAFLARRFDKKHGVTSPQRLLAWSLFEFKREDKDRFRAVFTLILLFPLAGASRRVRTMALEWLAVDALERGDHDAALRFARGKRSSFFMGSARKLAFRIKLEELMDAPSRSTWEPIPRIPNYQLGSSPLLRALHDALRAKPRPIWDLRRRHAPAAVLTKAERRQASAAAVMADDADVGDAPGLLVALQRYAHRGTPISHEDSLEAELLLERWREEIRASEEDLDWAHAQVEELIYDDGGPLDDGGDIDPERVAARITAIAGELEDSERVRDLGTWDLFSRLLEVEALMQRLEVGDADYVIDVWEAINSSVVSCGADLWNERNEQPLGHLFIAWAGARAFTMRDSYALDHTLSNFRVMG